MFRVAYHALRQVQSLGIAKLGAAISSGSHGQGIALAASFLGLSAHVVMTKPVLSLKYHAAVVYGGKVMIIENQLIAKENVQEVVV